MSRRIDLSSRLKSNQLKDTIPQNNPVTDHKNTDDSGEMSGSAVKPENKSNPDEKEQKEPKKEKPKKIKKNSLAGKMYKRNEPQPEDSEAKPITKKKKRKESEAEPTVFTREQIEVRQAEIQDQIENRYEEIEQQELKKQRRWKVSTRIFNTLLILACVYMIFLIYGVIVTNYAYNEEGVIKPQIMSVNDIAKKKAYETILVQYEKCRLLYEQVLLLDYRLGEGQTDPLLIAPEYEKLLENKKEINVQNLTIKLDALEVDTAYTNLKSMLLSWVRNDMGLYLQFVSKAITGNDVEAGNQAVYYKNVLYNDFSIITQNMTTIGDSIKGVDITHIKEWSPEKYIDEAVNGK